MKNVIKSWIAEQLAMQAQSVFVFYPVFFGCGILAYFSLSAEPSIYLGGGPCLILGLWIVREKSYFSQQLLIFLLLFALGFSASVVRSGQVRTPILKEEVKYANVEGRVVDFEWMNVSKKHVRMVLDDISVEELDANDTPVRVRLTVRSKEHVSMISVGSRVRGLASLRALSDPVVPDGFDFKRYFYFQGIGATGFFYRPPEIVGKYVYDLWGNYFSRARAVVQRNIFSVSDLSTAAVISALITGDRDAVSRRDMEDIRSSGLAHMLAISGLHVGLFSGFVFYVFRLLVVSLPAGALFFSAKRIAAVCAFVSALIYVQLAGNTVPAQRALIMVGVVFLAIILDRSAISMRLVAFAALCILFFMPEKILSISFQLSFVAVVALVAVYDALRPVIVREMSKGGFVRLALMYLIGVCVTSIVAALATAPVTAYYFHELPVYGLLANLLAVPLLSFVVMPCAVLALFAMMFNWHEYPLRLMGWGVEQIMFVAGNVSSLPYAQLIIPAMSTVSFALLVATILWLCLFRGGLRYASALLFVGAFAFGGGKTVPDIFVAEGHKLWGYAFAADKFVDRSDDYLRSASEPQSELALYLSNTRKDRFTREGWRSYYGLSSSQVQHFNNSGEELACDEDACRLSMVDYNISFVRAREVLKSECDWADILITQRSVRKSDRCGAKNIIDYWRVKNNGAYGIYLGQGGVRLEPIQGNKETSRPWD